MAFEVPAIELANVSFRFGRNAGRWLLRDQSLKIVPGASIGIVGRSGSGKSTLGLLIAGLLAPTKGAVQLCGERTGRTILGSLRTADMVEMLFQDPRQQLHPRRRVGEWLALVSTAQTLADADPARALADVGLRADLVNRLPSELSGGECQRIVLAKVLLGHAPILVFDEFANMLDVVNQELTFKLVEKYLIGTRTLIWIGHDEIAARRFCTDVFRLEGGTLTSI
jgi:peptide/nickel transport system ATP-binding protein